MIGSTACDKKARLDIQDLDERVSELELRVRENEARLYRQLEERVAQQNAQPETRPMPAEEPEEDNPPAEEEAADVPVEDPEPVEEVMEPMPEPEKKEDNPPETLVEGDFDVLTVYQKAYRDLEAMKYEEAEAGFRSITERAPEHKYAPNAMYWLGEVSYSQYNFNHAIVIFQRVLSQYPDSNKAPDALLKLAMSRDRLGQHEEAMDDYRRVIERYPETNAAKLAKTRL
ncbi:MAG: tol-pal system protein YbgF [Acidobacteriota bacterium]|nr:tol-pal system protein YbgF [Acidobacteriota bacterium]